MLKTSNAFARLRNAGTDVALARVIRTGTRGLLADSFRVAELRSWTHTSKRRALYRTYRIPKRSGGVRAIQAPAYRLKVVQRFLASVLAEGYSPPPAACHGYVPSRGIISNAQRHVGRKFVLRVDLRDFFPTIHYGRIRGVLLKAPYSLQPPIADLVARLCTFPVDLGTTILPQGAPTSPLLANLVCRGLDRDLTKMAKEQHWQYSRYADDLTFSTHTRLLPAGWVRQNNQQATLGPVLRRAIQAHGFVVNEEKVRLASYQQRQRVTGLIVNQKINVPRDYVRNLRAAVHCVKMHGSSVASERFADRFDLKYRPGGVSEPEFLRVLAGRLTHVAHVRGWDDAISLRIALQLREVDTDFHFDPFDHVGPLPELVVFGEGSTDGVHIQAALRWFKSQGRYLNLNLTSPNGSAHKGSRALLKELKSAAKYSSGPPRLFLFDSDEAPVVSEVSNEGNPRQWNPFVFSWSLPTPSHRQGPVCIEMMYKDQDLMRKDERARRLFLRDEFDEDGCHRTEPLRIKDKIPRSLIVDSNVVRSDSNSNVARTKAQFAEFISAAGEGSGGVDFSGFEPLMAGIRRLVACTFHPKPAVVALLKRTQ